MRSAWPTGFRSTPWAPCSAPASWRRWVEVRPLVEGYTEHAAITDFFKRWLDPRLQRLVGVQTVRHDGWQDLVKSARKKAELYLNEPGRGQEVTAAVVLLDLYGPAYPAGVSSPSEKLAWLRQRIGAGWQEPRFLIFCAVHETEAWLLSQPDLFPDSVRKALPGRCAHPETVNSDEPPAKLLDRCYRQKLSRGYKKVTDGSALFRRLDPEVAAGRCPQLRALLEAMLARARDLGRALAHRARVRGALWCTHGPCVSSTSPATSTAAAP